MLSNHQNNVLVFFRFNVDRFIEHMFATQSHQIAVVEDVFSPIITFLDVSIRGEMKLYPPGSQAHTRYTDMLIEANVTKRGSELSSELLIALSGKHLQ